MATIATAWVDVKLDTSGVEGSARAAADRASKAFTERMRRVSGALQGVTGAVTKAFAVLSAPAIGLSMKAVSQYLKTSAAGAVEFNARLARLKSEMASLGERILKLRIFGMTAGGWIDVWSQRLSTLTADKLQGMLDKLMAIAVVVAGLKTISFGVKGASDIARLAAALGGAQAASGVATAAGAAGNAAIGAAGVAAGAAGLATMPAATREMVRFMAMFRGMPSAASMSRAISRMSLASRSIIHVTSGIWAASGLTFAISAIWGGISVGLKGWKGKLGEWLSDIVGSAGKLFGRSDWAERLRAGRNEILEAEEREIDAINRRSSVTMSRVLGQVGRGIPDAVSELASRLKETLDGAAERFSLNKRGKGELGADYQRAQDAIDLLGGQLKEATSKAMEAKAAGEKFRSMEDMVGMPGGPSREAFDKRLKELDGAEADATRLASEISSAISQQQSAMKGTIDEAFSLYDAQKSFAERMADLQERRKGALAGEEKTMRRTVSASLTSSSDLYGSAFQAMASDMQDRIDREDEAAKEAARVQKEVLDIDKEIRRATEDQAEWARRSFSVQEEFLRVLKSLATPTLATI